MFQNISAAASFSAFVDVIFWVIVLILPFRRFFSSFKTSFVEAKLNLFCDFLFKIREGKIHENYKFPQAQTSDKNVFVPEVKKTIETH